MSMKKIFLALSFFLLSSVVIHADDTPQEFQGFNLAGYDTTGKKTWDLRGEKADMLGDIVKLTNIVGNAYGDETTNLTAKEGEMNKASGKMHLEKDVVITTDQGAKLTTDSLNWDRDKDLVTTDDKVVITRDNMVATGTGAVGHPSLKGAQLNKDVTVNVDTKSDKNPDGGTVTITSDGPMEVEYEKQRAVFTNNVVALENDRTLKADKMELFFDNETKQIKEMVCTGNVSIIQGQNTSYSEKAVYTAADKRLVLSGSPKLIFYTQGDNSVLKMGDTPKNDTAAQVEPKKE